VVKVKIYVAGASIAWQEARAVMDRIRGHGHEITYDWTKNVEEYGCNVDDPELRIKLVDADVKGVRKADMLVLLTQHQSIGKWIEFGVAVAMSKPVMFLGEEQPNTIFSSHYTVVGFPKNIHELLRLL
jgi:nucleoside 2-deoxyribosyltransferase